MVDTHSRSAASSVSPSELCWYSVFFLVKGWLFHNAFQLVHRDYMHGEVHYLATAFALVLALYLCIIVGVAYMAKSGRLTQGQHNDCKLLILAVAVPLYNVAHFSASGVLGGLRVHNWAFYFSFLMIKGVMLARLPMQHATVQWMLTAPSILLLDYYQKYGGTDTEGAVPRFSSIMSYLLTQGVWVLVSGLLGLVIPSIKLLKHNLLMNESKLESSSDICSKKTSDQAPNKTCNLQWHPLLSEEEPAPLETIGLKIFASGLIQEVDVLLKNAASNPKYSFWVLYTTVPIAARYFLSTLVSHFSILQSDAEAGFITKVTSEEWLVIMLLFFLLGRNRLADTRLILEDLMPSDVVDILLRSSPSHCANPVYEVCTENEEPTSEQSAESPLGGIECEIDCQSSGMYPSPFQKSHQEGTFYLRETIDAGNRNVSNLPAPSLSTKDFTEDTNDSWSISTKRPCSFSSKSNTSISFQKPNTQNLNPRRSSGSFNSGPRRPSLCLSSGPMAPRDHDCVTIFFSDLCGFSSWSHDLSPHRVMETLHDLYSRLDTVIENEFPSLYKVETIGDAYIVAANLNGSDPEHAAKMVRFAVRVHEEASQVPRPDLKDGSPLQLRIGLNSGPATSAVVGKIRRRFCLLGDTVNMASRTETTCPPGRIQVTATTYHLAAPYLDAFDDDLILCERGPVMVKGSDVPITMYLVKD